ncbi:hypothetical protein VN97_g11687, partial [Penicillium thymicola]
KEKN